MLRKTLDFEGLANFRVHNAFVRHHSLFWQAEYARCRDNKGRFGLPVGDKVEIWK